MLLHSYRKRMVTCIISLFYRTGGFEGLVLAGQTCLHLSQITSVYGKNFLVVIYTCQLSPVRYCDDFLGNRGIQFTEHKSIQRNIRHNLI